MRKWLSVKRLGFLALVGASLLFAGCNQPAQQDLGPHPSATGTVVIQVQDNEGNPVAGAVVSIAVPGGFEGTTDSNGTLVTTLPVGTYTATVTAPGYQSVSIELQVKAGQKVTQPVVLNARPYAPPPAGEGVCAPTGATGDFTFNLGKGHGDIKSIQLTQEDTSTEKCFVRGSIQVKVSTPATADLIQVAYYTDNPEARVILKGASDTQDVAFDLDTSTLPQGKEVTLVAHVDLGGGRVLDQTYHIVPDNLPPMLPDVDVPTMLVNADSCGTSPRPTFTRPWVSGQFVANITNNDLQDYPNDPGLLASGLAEIDVFAQPLDEDGNPAGSPVLIGTLYNSPYTLQVDSQALLHDGRYYVYAVSKDAMGNQSAAPYAGLEIGVDNTDPVASLTIIDNGADIHLNDYFPVFDRAYVSGFAKATFEANDTGVGLCSASLTYGSHVIVPPFAVTRHDWSLTGTYDVSSLSGPSTFVLSVKDWLGHEKVVSVTVNVDNTPPVISNLNAPSRVDAGQQAQFGATATDDNSGLQGIYYFYASSALAAATSPIWNSHNADFAALYLGKGSQINALILDPTNGEADDPDAAADVVVLAVDKAGNATAATLPLTVVHVANGDNTVTGGTFTATPQGDQTRYELSGFGKTEGSLLHAVFVSRGALEVDGKTASAWPSTAPAYLSGAEVIRMVQQVDTPPFVITTRQSVWGGYVFNELGHSAYAR